MSVPEGYETVASIDDHTIKLAVPVIGRDTPILIAAPHIEWRPPSEVEKVQEFLQPYIDAEAEIMEWQKAKNERDVLVETWHIVNDDRPEAEREPMPAELEPYPDEAKALLEKINMREINLRWLKPYMTSADYKLLTTSKAIPEKSIEDLQRRLTSKEITEGESSASTDSSESTGRPSNTTSSNADSDSET